MVPSPDPHAPRSPLEGAICSELRSQGVAHEHRSLHFRVRLDEREVAEYTPDLVARRGAILFLLEPLAESSGDPKRLHLLERFLETHSPEIVLILVTSAGDASGIPPSAYDEMYPSSEIPRIVRRIKDQDPRGIVLPFRKPERGTSGEDDVREDV